MDSIAIVNKEDLFSFLREEALNRFSGIDITAQTVMEILCMSESTLNRYVSQGIIKTIPSNKEKRAVRKFDLAYILSLDRSRLRSDYKEIIHA